VDKSLVVAEATGEGVLRYRMLEPVRQYAREKLEESGEAESLRSRHARFFLALAEEAAPMLQERDQAAWVKRLETEHPDLVVHRMTKSLRPGKVLVDWSQNSAAKTTVSVYSLRARERPTVSTPVTWDEVGACRSFEDLVFTSDDVLDRVERLGDLFSPLLG